MGNAMLAGTQVGAMHALRDLMFDTTLNAWALPTIVQPTAQPLTAGVSRPGQAIPLGLAPSDILNTISFQGVHLARRKCHILARPVGGLDTHCCLFPAPHHLQDGPHLQRSLVESKASVSPFQVVQHSHWVPVPAPEKHPARGDIPAYPPNEYPHLLSVRSSVAAPSFGLGMGVPSSSWDPWEGGVKP